MFTTERLSADTALRHSLRQAPTQEQGRRVRLPVLKRTIPEGLYGRLALAYFRAQGVGPDVPPQQLWLPLWHDEDPGPLW